MNDDALTEDEQKLLDELSDRVDQDAFEDYRRYWASIVLTRRRTEREGVASISR